MITPAGDKLIVCKCCGSNACYESEFKAKDCIIKTWLCMTCGFTSNTTMEANSDTLKKLKNLLLK